MNTNTALPRTGCNSSLPTNALNVDEVRAGMTVRYPYDGTGIHTVLSVEKGYGDRVIIVTDKGRTEARTYGTVRLITDAPYNYHNGCCNKS